MANGSEPLLPKHIGPITSVIQLESELFAVSQAGIQHGHSNRFLIPSFIESDERLQAIDGDKHTLFAVGGSPGVSGFIGTFNRHSQRWERMSLSSDLLYRVILIPDRKRLVTAGADGKVYQTSHPAESRPTFEILYTHTQPVRALAVSPNQQFLASGSLDGLVKVYRLGNGNEPVSIQDHTDKVECVLFSPDSRFIVSGARDGKVRIHTLQGRLLKTYQLRPIRTKSWNYQEQILSLAADDSFSRIIAGSISGQLYKLDPQDSDWIHLQTMDGPIYSLLSTEEQHWIAGTTRLHRFKAD